MYVILCVADFIDTSDLVLEEMPEENVLPWKTTSKIMQLKGWKLFLWFLQKYCVHVQIYVL